MGGYENKISNRKIYDFICNWRNGIFLLEVLVRGYSHYSMFLCGGACFLCCGLLNENMKIKMSFISQMVLSALIITALEFITGLIVNIWLKMDIWDYSQLPYNFMGADLFVIFHILVSCIKCSDRAR